MAAPRMALARDGGVVVIGAAGFLGRAVCAELTARGTRCRAIVRAAPAGNAGSVEAVPGGNVGSALAVPGGDVEMQVVGDLAAVEPAALAAALEGCDAVINLAGRAHMARGNREDALARLRRDNVTAAWHVARAAALAGTPRVIHVSSVKVNGEWTEPGRPFRPTDVPDPKTAYGHSKLAGERVVQEALAGTSTALAILRLPLVYGPGAPANFARLVRAVRRRRLLPLGAIDNRRQLLGLANGAEGLVRAATSPRVVVGTHYLADASSVSTAALIRAVAAALECEPRLLAVPPAVLRVAAVLSGQRAAIERLTRSLEVDITSLTDALGWQPRPFHLDRNALPA
jgi:nucleoside-diphosphate-sugar epimerase